MARIETGADPSRAGADPACETSHPVAERTKRPAAARHQPCRIDRLDPNANARERRAPDHRKHEAASSSAPRRMAHGRLAAGRWSEARIRFGPLRRLRRLPLHCRVPAGGVSCPTQSEAMQRRVTIDKSHKRKGPEQAPASWKWQCVASWKKLPATLLAFCRRPFGHPSRLPACCRRPSASCRQLPSRRP